MNMIQFHTNKQIKCKIFLICVAIMFTVLLNKCFIKSNTGLVGTFICNKVQTILLKRTLISCTQIEKVDNVDTCFFS